MINKYFKKIALRKLIDLDALPIFVNYFIIYYKGHFKFGDVPEKIIRFIPTKVEVKWLERSNGFRP